MSIVFTVMLVLALQGSPIAPSLPPSGSLDPEAKPSAVADPLRDAGVPTPDRLKALARPGTSVAAATWQAIEACDRCGAANDLATILASRPAAEIAPLGSALLAASRDENRPVLRGAAARALVALPADQRPGEAKDLRETTLTLQCVRGRMAWEPKELQVLPGTLVRLRMENGDSMLHNLLLTAPGSLTEIGVAAEKLGEGLDGKRRQYVPESPKVMAVMGLVEPGKVGELWFFAPSRSGTYVLVCTYPGHWRMMNGKLKVK
ncbi:MAG: hypothetical protein EBQ99_00405 [Planctomycetes bacterium]|nr:hypothetical protein [Planctomycetota bacterium]